jgi:hypothetical protein
MYSFIYDHENTLSNQCRFLHDREITATVGFICSTYLVLLVYISLGIIKRSLRILQVIGRFSSTMDFCTDDSSNIGFD